MIQPPSPQSEDEINLVYDKLQAGVDWAELCKEHSDDRRTAENGGELAPFSRGQIVPAFADAAFSLDSPGQISDPIKTQFGWHIIKLIEKIPLKSFDEMEEELTRRVKRDSRNDVNQQVLIERLSKENNLKRFEDGEQELMSLPKTLYVDGRWRLDSSYLQSSTVLFSIQDTSFAVGAFLKQMMVRIPHDSTATFLNKRLTEYRDQALVDYEKAHLSDKYDDYRFLSKEYYEGILLFSIMETEIWNKALVDSVDLENFYMSAKENYPRQKGTEAIVFSSSEKQILMAVADSLRAKPLKNLLSETEKQSFTDKYTDGDRVSLSIEQGYFVEGENPNVEAVSLDTLMEIIESGNSAHLVVILGRYDDGVEPLKNIRGRVMADYQDYLEKQWVKQLKSKYTVDIDSKTLNYVYKQARK